MVFSSTPSIRFAFVIVEALMPSSDPSGQIHIIPWADIHGKALAQARRDLIAAVGLSGSACVSGGGDQSGHDIYTRRYKHT